MIRKNGRKASRATVYRTLDILVKYDLASKFILDDGIVNIFPVLSTACIDSKTSLNSLSKHQEFIFNPPPIVPGIQDKNSNPPR